MNQTWQVHKMLYNKKKKCGKSRLSQCVERRNWYEKKWPEAGIEYKGPDGLPRYRPWQGVSSDEDLRFSEHKDWKDLLCSSRKLWGMAEKKRRKKYIYIGEKDV